MKKWIALLTMLLTLLLSTVTVSAAGGHVTYDGNAQTFIFAPGSRFSPTDLFTDLKDVMPGDTRTQHITLRNDAARNVKTKIWLRSEYADEASRKFFSQLQMSLQVGNSNGQAYMFSPSGTLTADNDGWVLLGTLYSGGEVDLALQLYVPTELDNEFMGRLGIVDWTFKAEELDKEPSDPTPPPKTGENTALWILWAVAGSALLLIFILSIRIGKERTKK